MPHNPISDLRDSVLRADACAAHPSVARSRSIEEAALWAETVQKCPHDRRVEHLRWLARNDLFFLLVYLLNRKHLIGLAPSQKDLSDALRKRIADWTFARCSDVQNDPDNNLDLWPREHEKSEIITYGKTIQDVLIDSNETIGIFSHTRPMAKQFLRQIKVEFETNIELQKLFPDILWENPKLESPKWAEDEGIVLKRKSNRKESTIEAWGLIDGQPTSKRFTKLVYDDVNGRKETTPDMIAKSTSELQNSFALTASDPPVIRYVGTFQEIDDTSHALMASGVYKVRLFSAVAADGAPIFFSEAKLAWFKERLSPKIFALQFLLDPKKAREDQHIGFAADWMVIRKVEPNRNALNRYILVDPAGKGKESNSHFAAWVIGLGADKRRQVLDGYLDNLSLTERADLIFKLVKEFDPLKVVYESYAMQGDIEHIRDRQERENFRFMLVEVGGNQQSKDQRIERLMPLFRDKMIIFPPSLHKQNSAGEPIDVMKYFIDNEYSRWPYNPKQRDLLDALSRLCDDPIVNYVFPRAYGSGGQGGGHWNQSVDAPGGWMSE